MVLKEGKVEIQDESPDTIRIQWGSTSWLHFLLMIVLGQFSEIVCSSTGSASLP